MYQILSGLAYRKLHSLAKVGTDTATIAYNVEGKNPL